MRDDKVDDKVYSNASSFSSPASRTSIPGRYEWESKMQEAPHEILRIVEEQRKREALTWRRMESRENELRGTLLRKEKDKVHELLGEIDVMKKELEKVKEDNATLQKSNILQKQRINQYEEEMLSLQQDKDSKARLETNIQDMLTTLKVVSNDNEVLKATLDSEMLKHISQLKQYQAALSLFEQLKVERSKYKEISLKLEKKCQRAMALNLTKKLQILMLRLHRARQFSAFHKWIHFSKLRGQAHHLHHIHNRKVHEVKHEMKHDHQKAMQEMKQQYEKEILDKTKLHNTVVAKKDLLVRRVEKGRSVAASKYLADSYRKSFFLWIKTCFKSQRNKCDVIKRSLKVFNARAMLLLSKMWIRLMVRKAFSKWMSSCISCNMCDCRHLRCENLEIKNKMRKLEAGYYKRLTQTVLTITSRRALKMKMFFQWHRMFFQSILTKGVVDDNHSVSSKYDTQSVISNSSLHTTPRHHQQHHQHEHQQSQQHHQHQQHQPSHHLQQTLSSPSNNARTHAHGFRDELRTKLRINTNISPTNVHRTYLSSLPSSTSTDDRRSYSGRKAWSPSGNNLHHGPYRLENGKSSTSSRLPSPRSDKTSPAITPVSQRSTPSPRAQCRI